jgi:hypothetical protein
MSYDQVTSAPLESVIIENPEETLILPKPDDEACECRWSGRKVIVNPCDCCSGVCGLFWGSLKLAAAAASFYGVNILINKTVDAMWANSRYGTPFPSWYTLAEVATPIATIAGVVLLVCAVPLCYCGGSLCRACKCAGVDEQLEVPALPTTVPDD